MTPEERALLYRIADFVDQLTKSDRIIIPRLLQMQDGRNIQLGRGTGTKIGTVSDQKLGFFGAAPVIKQTASDTSLTADAVYSTAERDMLNAMFPALVAYGLI